MCECEPVFNEDGWPVAVEHPEYGGVFFLKEDCPDCPPSDYTDADYYAYHDADGKLLDKEEG
jgi:hypothetical protein